jgi:hypothetical protein
VKIPLPRELTGLCLDCFLLARYAPPGVEGRPDGRAWERAVSGLLWRPGLPRRQHAGTLGIFERGSASGAAHEIDGAGHGGSAGIWIEAKALEALDKSHVAVFDLKCWDLYTAAVQHDPGSTGRSCWWPLLVSSEPATDPVRRLCIALGIILCDPARMPLPVLLRGAAHPEADLLLPEVMLAEAVRLFSAPCRPIQERWPLSDNGEWLMRGLRDHLDARTIGDALYVQDELTADLLDYFDLDAPGALERRAEELTARLDRRTRELA